MLTHSSIEAESSFGISGVFPSLSIIFFTSDNDRCVTEKDSLEFGRRIGAEMILEKNRGHFTEDDDVTQLPALLERIVKISG